MSSELPSRETKQTQPWDQILARIVQVQGAEIFAEILKQKLAQGAPPVPRVSPPQVLAKLAEMPGQLRSRLGSITRSLRQLRYGPRREEPLQKAALETLSLAGFIGGCLFGIQLPQLDLRLAAKGKERDALILHAAALMATEVAVEWIQEILKRTLLTPSLSESESRFLRAISYVLSSSLRGVERGWSARQLISLWARFSRSPVAREHQVATDARAVQLIQDWVERFRVR